MKKEYMAPKMIVVDIELESNVCTLVTSTAELPTIYFEEEEWGEDWN